MRRALATAAVAGALVLVPLTATAATAEQSVAGGPVLSQTGPDVDEPALQDGNDDTGKYGLIGLSGMLGLFGYKNFREHQAARTSDSTDGTSRRT